MSAKQERRRLYRAKKALQCAEARYRKVLRERAARRQGGLCIYCERPFGEDRPATFEHLVPLSRGGTDTSDNCAASCFACNQERGDANHGAFLRYKQAQKEATAFKALPGAEFLDITADEVLELYDKDDPLDLHDDEPTVAIDVRSISREELDRLLSLGAPEEEGLPMRN